MAKTFPTESSPSPFKDDGGLFYKVVRLKTGESVLCTMSKNVTSVANESYLTMGYPVQAVLSKQMTKDDNVVGELFILRPWIGLSTSSEFVMPTDIVLTIGDLRAAVKIQYLKYLEETKKAEEIFEAQRKQEEQNEMDDAIFRLLSDVNPGKKIHILRDDN